MALTMTRTHLLYDIWLADAEPLCFIESWQPLLRKAAEAGNATILQEEFHQFDPQGVTGFLLLAESHISVHTWPEEKFAAIDIFTCGKLDPQIVVDYLRKQLMPVRERLSSVDRG